MSLKKSPFLAGTFSAIIPGSGYLYSGQKGTAITSFIINGVLIWAISDAIKHKHYGLASAAGVFGIGWYFGNISGSVEAAEKYNKRIHRELYDELLKRENLKEYISGPQFNSLRE